MITMVLERWYVFVFLVAFLGLAGRRFGVWRTVVWLVSGYLIALASEASSIRNGFPYGWYHYVYENLVGEPLILGVPLWDSLSYPFLIYAGYSVAQYGWPRLSSALQALLGAFLTMLLDIIIDPVAHLGQHWFLGEIYDYSHPGHYFGIPLSNFLGWFLVPWLVILANQRLVAQAHPANGLDIGFYAGIALFNIGIAFSIGAWPLGLCSSVLMLAALWTIRRSHLTWSDKPTTNDRHVTHLAT